MFLEQTTLEMSAGAVGEVDDARELLQHTGLVDLAALKADLARARAALVTAQETAAAMGIEAHDG